MQILNVKTIVILYTNMKKTFIHEKMFIFLTTLVSVQFMAIKF